MNRACPIVLRNNNSNLELLAFKHPNGENQFVKDNIHKGEALEKACIRELKEESGIQTEAVRGLGLWDSNFNNQI